MNSLRETAYQIDPVAWVREVLGVKPAPWQEKFLRAPRGASVLALTARQNGKTTTAAWAMAHSMIFAPGSLSVVVCPAQRQSGEAVRRVKDCLVKAGLRFKSDNVYGLELENGSRVLALPGSDESIRGLTVDGWIVADEAARLTDDLIAAVRPMRARKPQTRFAMLSTPWSRTDPFWTAWTDEDPSWLRLQATADIESTHYAEASWRRNDALWVKTTSSANISVSLPAVTPVRSPGTYTSVPRNATFPWCPPAVCLPRRPTIAQMIRPPGPASSRCSSPMMWGAARIGPRR